MRSASTVRFQWCSHSVERDDFLVGPHPGRPAVEGMEHFVGVATGVGIAFDKPIDAVAIGPVALDGDQREALFADQSLTDQSPPDIEFGRAVRSLAEQDVAGVADAGQQRIEVCPVVERSRDLADRLGDLHRRRPVPAQSSRGRIRSWP